MIEFFDLTGKTILLTGGTGSFGRKFIDYVLKNYSPKAIRIFSRDEMKQYQLMQEMSDKRLRFLIGDVRDKERLIRATRGVDVLVHAAAMKQVPTCEYNPFEAVKTNVMGAISVISAALENKVPKVIALSTDKAVNPVNIYGATKLVSDKLFVHANVYSGFEYPRFSLVRYGNVLGSRGSVVPLFLKQRETGVLTLTDERMTRFWLTLDQAVELVLKGLSIMQGGEIFIPKIPSMKITDLAEAIAPGCKKKFIGIRPGEKIHEVLVNEEEGRHTYSLEDIYIVTPSTKMLEIDYERLGEKVPGDFIYSSDKNDWWLTPEELRTILREQGLLI